MTRLFGIDFSGNHESWKPNKATSNVWIASGGLSGASIELHGLARVQQLPGDGHPFARLSRFLNEPSAGFAAIDAPFSLPSPWSPDPEALWQAVSEFDREGRPFARGQHLVDYLTPGIAEGDKKKVFRDTERYWQSRRVNVRSTVWNGPRGGAPFAVACMALLAAHKGPVWPFRPDGRGVTLAEAFPAGQLAHWGLPHQKYDKSRDTRAVILAALESRHGLVMQDGERELCHASPDALDAVVCLYGAAALASNRFVRPDSERYVREGWIAVHQ